jgi:hypothetical protein
MNSRSARLSPSLAAVLGACFALTVSALIVPDLTAPAWGQSRAAADDAVWRNVTQDRTLNAMYRNLTEHAIQVSVATRSDAPGHCMAKLWVNDVAVAYQVSSGGGEEVCSVSATIPRAGHYLVETDGPDGGRLELWAEMY